MKSITKFHLLLLVSMFALTASAEEAETRGKTEKCILQKVCSIDARLQCNNAISFGSADINKPGGYVITQPGYYCLKEDVTFNPIAPTADPATNPVVQPAITIRASNVFLDLGPHTLRQAGEGTSTQVPYGIGILIPDIIPTSEDTSALAPGGLQSIYIKGDDPAIIQGFSMFGIRVFGHTYDIQIRDITVKNCGGLASKLLRPFPAYIPHTTGDNPNPMSIAGISIGEVFFEGTGATFFTESPINLTSAVILENVFSLNNFYQGIEVVNVTDITINGCHFDDQWSNQEAEDLPFAITPTGGTFVFDTNVNVFNSTFNRTQMRGDFQTPLGSASMGGVVASSSNQMQWNNCQFNDTSNTFFNTAFNNFTAGFFSGGLVDTTFTNCSFDGVQAVAGANGFHMSRGFFNEGGKNVKLLNCTARNVKQIGNQAVSPAVTTNIQAVGFVVDFASDIVIENCAASDVIVNGPMDTAGIAAGFRILHTIPPASAGTVSENFVVRGCTAQRALALNGGQANGFLIRSLITSATSVMRAVSVENCVAEGNIASPGSGAVPGTASIGCGFYLEGNTSVALDIPWSLSGCKALRNKGAFSAVVGGIIKYSAGYYFLASQRAELYQNEAVDNVFGFLFQNSDRNAIRECRADNNQDAGNGGGFFDLGPAGTPLAPGISTSTFENNRAFNNGDGVTQDGNNGNYNIIYNAVGPVLEPALLVDLSAGTAAVNGSFGATYFANFHNIATRN